MTRQHPTASFPTSVWDGVSLSRDDTNVVKQPDFDDWNRAVAELIATQNKIVSLEAAIAASVTTEIVTLQDATYGGGLVRKSVAVQGTATAAETFAIPVAIPAGAKLLGVQLRVDVLLTSSDGGTTWEAAFDTGSTTAICSGAAFTKNTKTNKMLNEITTDATGITVTCNGGKLFAAGGKITAIVYYEELAAIDSAA